MMLFYYIQSNFLNQLQNFTFKENIAEFKIKIDEV